MTLEELEKFVETNKTALTAENQIARCVDGRYDNLENFPLIAKPGGDAGDVMVVFGALNILEKTLPPQTVFKLVIDNIDGVKNFNFHSDSHADPQTPGLGCGHIKQAKLDPGAYGLTTDQIEYIVAQLPELIAQGAHQEVLQGDHAEQAVVVINSDSFGIKPLLRSGETISQVFVYQKTLHEKQLYSLAQKLQEAFAEQGAVIEEVEVRDALDKAFSTQLTETLNRLAKGLPVFVVNIDENGETEASQ